MYADAHCDTLTKAYDNGFSLYENPCQLDFSRLKEQGCSLQFMAVWIEPKYEPSGAFKRCNDVLDFYYSQISDDINTVLTRNGISDDKLNVLLSVEGGSALEGKIDNLYRLYERGVRAITLTWNGDNCIGGGIDGNNKGLTAFGKEVVREMNRLGMIVDVSHLSERGFWEVAELCNQFIASHSNCRALCNHRRNLTDEQIKCIAKRNGFIGLNFYSDFLNEKNATVNDIIRHAEHIASLGGEHVLGFGSDFDGMDKLPDGIAGVENMAEIVCEFFKNDLLYANLYRNIKQILKN